MSSFRKMRAWRGAGLSVLCGVAVVLALGAKATQAVPYKAQASQTFISAEAAPAYGLTVTLSSSAEVATDADTGHAGPFRNVAGNGTGKITLTNPDKPVEAGGEGFELIFQTYSKKVAVTAWWWTDIKGKRIGEKHKP